MNVAYRLLKSRADMTEWWGLIMMCWGAADVLSQLSKQISACLDLEFY